MELLLLEPVFKQMIWGGSRLKDDFGYDIPGDNTGECWAISAHPHGDCTLKNTEYKGKTLSWLWENHRELFGNVQGDRFPLLIKIIDAKADLSIQVHPDDAYAAEHENGSLGKMECWYILDAKEGGTIVIGHNAKNHEEVEEMIRGKRWKEFIREIPVKKGDFFQINPGCAMMRELHGIGNNLNQIAAKAHTLNALDVQRYDENCRKLDEAIKTITAAVILPRPMK